MDSVGNHAKGWEQGKGVSVWGRRGKRASGKGFLAATELLLCSGISLAMSFPSLMSVPTRASGFHVYKIEVTRKSGVVGITYVGRVSSRSTVELGGNELTRLRPNKLTN